MKKAIFLILFSALVFISCEKEFSGVVDYTPDNFQVISVAPSGEVFYNALDSLITIRINFLQNSKVAQVTCDIYSPDNRRMNSSPIILFDNGNPEFGDDIANDNRFANKFPLSTYDPVGVYSIRFYTSTAYSGNKQIAQTSFDYNNGQENIAPVISNLVMVDSTTSNPIDSINVDRTFIFSVQADDPNGYNDISIVYFELFRPDGSVVTDGSGNSKFRMFDNGNIQVYGDAIAGDSIFSFKNKFLDDPSTQRGNWTFEFQAQDRGGLLSNKLTKVLKVL